MNNQRNRISGIKKRENLGNSRYNTQNNQRIRTARMQEKRNDKYRKQQRISQMSKHEFINYFTEIIKKDKEFMTSHNITEKLLQDAVGKYFDENTNEISSCDEDRKTGGVKTNKIINDIKKLAISILTMIIIATSLVGCTNDKINATKFIPEPELINYTGIYDATPKEGLITMDGHIIEDIADYDVYRISIKQGETQSLQVREKRDVKTKGVIEIENGRYVLASREVIQENGKKWVKIYCTGDNELYVREDCLQRVEEYPKDCYNLYDINVISNSEGNPLKLTTICDNKYYIGNNGEEEVIIPKKIADDNKIFSKIDKSEMDNYCFVTLTVDQPSIGKKGLSKIKIVDFIEDTTEIDNPKIYKGSILLVKEYDKHRLVTIDGYILDKNDTNWAEITSPIEMTTKMKFDYKNGPGEIEGVLGIDVAPGQSMKIEEFKKLITSNIAENIDKNAKPKFVYLKIGATLHNDEFSTNSDVTIDNVIEFVKICEENSIPYGFYYYTQACTEQEHMNECNVISDKIKSINQSIQGGMRYNVLPFSLDIERGGQGRMVRKLKDGTISKEQLTEYKEKMMEKLKDDENINSVIIYASKNTFNELILLDQMKDENKSNMWYVCPIDTESHGEYISNKGLDDNVAIRQVILDKSYNNGTDYDVNFMTLDFYKEIMSLTKFSKDFQNDNERGE